MAALTPKPETEQSLQILLSYSQFSHLVSTQATQLPPLTPKPVEHEVQVEEATEHRLHLLFTQATQFPPFTPNPAEQASQT